jgi:Fe2+ transport system protein FeoA
MKPVFEPSGCQRASGEACAPGVCSLAALGVGRCGTVVAVGGETELRRRLLEMGLCGGATIECVRRAPLGDPIEFRVRGYLLSLRGEQARFVTVQAV